MAKLSHYGQKGEVRMVDVSEKAVTTRTAAARGFVKMKPRVVSAVRRVKNPKGNPLEVARIAGIAAAKRTAEWIPLCHPLPLTHIDVTARLCQNGVEVRSTVTTAAQTGVEIDRKSTRLNSSHGYISYAVFCLKKKKTLGELLNSSPVPSRSPA